jgi:hypothetical protein
MFNDAQSEELHSAHPEKIAYLLKLEKTSITALCRNLTAEIPEFSGGRRRDE